MSSTRARAGKAADLVGLERNLFVLAPDSIGEVRILETLAADPTVFCAPMGLLRTGDYA